MALYEYLCESCKGGKPYRFELRMPMKDVVQVAPCPQCGKQAQKTIGAFAVTGLSKTGFGDGSAPWDDMDMGDMDMGGMDMGGMGMGGMGMDDPMMGHSHDHGHDHGHPHGHDDLGLDDMAF